MRTLVAAALATALASAAVLAQCAGAVPQISEQYQCRGQGQQGGYTTPLTIEQTGSTYRLRWQDSFGQGFRVGNILLGYYLLGEGHGAILYYIEPGRLDGEWFFEDDTQTYKETCVAGLPV